MHARFIKWLLYKGCELKEETFDQLVQDTMGKMFDIISDPVNHLMFDLEPGEIQFMNNFVVAHSRSDYEDTGGKNKNAILLEYFCATTVDAV